MSYNVAIVISPVPTDDVEAWAAVDRLIRQQGPRPAVFQELHDQLTARYPCMCSVPDDQIDNTVWSDGPLINNFLHRAAVLGMSYSRDDEVLPFLIGTANALGLVVFDWATDRVYRAYFRHTCQSGRGNDRYFTSLFPGMGPRSGSRSLNQAGQGSGFRSYHYQGQPAADVGNFR
jgi:hypothetical protein